MSNQTEEADAESVSRSAGCAQAERTEGPWQAEGASVKGGEGEEVFDAPVRKHFGHGWDNNHIRRGNALLMAAAPEMYDAIKSLLSTRISTDIPYGIRQDLKDAIAKAEGKA